jgi:hypothetical protein
MQSLGRLVFRLLAISTLAILLWAVGGIAIIGLIYASSSAGVGAGILFLIICCQLPLYILLKKMGLLPAVGLYQRVEVEEDSGISQS